MPSQRVPYRRSSRALVAAARLVPIALLAAMVAAPATAAAPPAAPAPPAPTGKAVATFAMGCFWCAEDAFEGLPGVESVVSGYTGGRVQDPTYEQVSGHGTGHWEAIQVVFDPQATSYEKLLDVFWHNVDPTDSGGQFCDRGDQYRAAVFFHGADQKRLAEASRQRVAQELNQGVATKVLPAVTFYEAEEYHQDYAARNALRYSLYTRGCGRAARLRAVWGEKAGGH